MTVIALLIIAAISIHLLWLRRKKKSLMPPLGSRWLCGCYLSAYRAKVVEHHPFSGEITIVKSRLDDPRLTVTLRIKAKSFLSSARPAGDDRG